MSSEAGVQDRLPPIDTCQGNSSSRKKETNNRCQCGVPACTRYTNVGGAIFLPNKDRDVLATCLSRLGCPAGPDRADKGFMMHGKFSERLHRLEVPAKAANGQTAFSSDQMRQTAQIARVRIHVERAFRRAQEFMILHRRVPITQVDLWGMIFRICCYLCNFQPPLIAEKESNPDDTDAKQAVGPAGPKMKKK